MNKNNSLLGNNILYKYKSIDHIINRSKINSNLRYFIIFCKKFNIKIMKKIDDYYEIYNKEYVLGQINETKKSFIKIQIKMLSDVVNEDIINEEKYINTINLKQNIIKYFKNLDKIKILIDIIYENDLLKLEKYIDLNCDIIYQYYVNFNGIKKKTIIDAYNMQLNR